MRVARVGPSLARVSGMDHRTYAAECYEPGVREASVEDAAQRADAAASALRANGREVEYREALLMPGDEVVFHLFAAEDPDSVREACAHAQIGPERILDVIEVGGRPLET